MVEYKYIGDELESIKQAYSEYYSEYGLVDVIPSLLELRLLVANIGDRVLVSRLLHFLPRILRCSMSAVIPGFAGFIPRSTLSFALS